MKFKSIMRISPTEKKVRLARFIWERGTVGDGNGYSACLSLALISKLFGFERRRMRGYDYRLVILGMSFHYMRSYGGRFV